MRWRNALKRSTALKMSSGDMYVGRSIAEAKKVAHQLNAPLYVVSTGLGLIGDRERIVPYDLTVSGSQGGLRCVLDKYGATTAEWWEIISNGHGIAATLKKYHQSILLVALPAKYVEMVAKDLGKCNREQIERLRLFTSKAAHKSLSNLSVDVVMPYDSRLESVTGYAGTQSDFPQRAMRHFVESLNAHHCTLEEAHEKVSRSLKGYKKRKSVERIRADDESIKILLRQNWKTKDGRSSLLLRYLRDEALVACEQRRFAQLWREVRSEKSGPN